MKIAVLSDSHGRLGSVRAAIKLLEEDPVEQIVFCGDIGGDEVVELLRRWPTHYVWGNTDQPEIDAMRAAMKRFGHTNHERFGELEWEGIKIAFLHGDNEQRLSESIASGQYDLVCHGHTHVVRNEYVGKTLVLNPGALHRAAPRSFAIVELPSLSVQIRSLPATV